MRQANKILDETMVAKVNTIIEEKIQLKILDLEKIKVCI